VIGSLTLSFAQSNDISRPPKQGKAAISGRLREDLDRVLSENLILQNSKKKDRAFQFNIARSFCGLGRKGPCIDQQLQAMVESGNFNEEQATQLVNTKTPLMANLEICGSYRCGNP